jgi:hypothetical protein
MVLQTKSKNINNILDGLPTYNLASTFPGTVATPPVIAGVVETNAEAAYLK